MRSGHAELLLPGGSPETLRIAVHYGADAVYLGGEALGLRAAAKNFSRDELNEAVRFAHGQGVKIYITANIFAHGADLATAEDFFAYLEDLLPDGVLISDPGLFALARRICPDVPIHISTQANTTNAESVRFWCGAGAKRIVLARELSLEEIRAISDAVGDTAELECFVHGAMCVSYSGRCLLSNYFTGRDANAGACTHPCRWKYALVEESRPGEYLPVEEDGRGTYLFDSKDLCMIDHLPDLYEAGIQSFKIEGRMKNALYTAVCARTYDLARKAYETDPKQYDADRLRYREQIALCSNRGFSTGFYYGKPKAEAQNYDGTPPEMLPVYLGFAEECGRDQSFVLTQKNKFCVGDEIEILKADGRDLLVTVRRIEDENGAAMDCAPHPRQRLRVFFEGDADAVPEPYDVIRKLA